ncbi:MAG: hypothetical protein HY275_06085 [Gemmatimonadetes bacterium]|nr:hypothetical protein [Gemmatimonadota bacterium]
MRVAVHSRSFTALLGLTVSLAALPALGAQGKGKVTEPKRPKVEADMDTNDAQAYLLVGAHQIDDRPAVARDAYWWAVRLDPGSAQAWYGLYMATIFADDGLVRMQIRGADNARDRAEERRLDSLDLRVELLNPFMRRNLESRLVAHIASVLRVSPQLLTDDLQRRSDVWFGRISLWDGNLPLALDGFARALRTAKQKAGIHATRGLIFQQMGNVDSSMASFKLAVTEARKIEDTALVRFYQPKARYLYQMGWLLESLEKPAEAKEMYGQALVEDLSFYPAHQRIALLALAAGDTTTALAEFDLAVQAGPQDVVLRLQYAYALAATRKLAEASQQVQLVINQEPWYADPYLMLARLYDATDMGDLALVNYRTFLDRSPNTDLQRAFATERLAALSATAAKSPGAP